MFCATDFSFFFEEEDDDYAAGDVSYERFVSEPFIPSSSMINACLTITEENEEELEELQRDDQQQARKEEAEDELKNNNHLSKINDGSIPKVTLHDNDDRADLLENDQQRNSLARQLTMINEDYDERLSTIYEAPSPQLRTEEEDIYDDAYDKLVVYDIANVKPIEKVNSSPLKYSLLIMMIILAINHSYYFQT